MMHSHISFCYKSNECLSKGSWQRRKWYILSFSSAVMLKLVQKSAEISGILKP